VKQIRVIKMQRLLKIRQVNSAWKVSFLIIKQKLVYDSWLCCQGELVGVTVCWREIRRMHAFRHESRAKKSTPSEQYLSLSRRLKIDLIYTQKHPVNIKQFPVLGDGH
jgi:hypothetical protein